MSSLIVLNPTGQVRSRVREGALAPRLAGFDTGTIGLIDDGLLGSEYYMRGLERLLQDEFPGIQTRFWLKPILSRPAPANLIEEAVERCDAVIVGSAG